MDKVSNQILKGYFQGIFPMSNSREDDKIFFVNPDYRAIIPIDNVHISKSLTRAIKKRDYKVTTNKSFSKVMDSCRSPLFGREETWINNTIFKTFNELHMNGFAHSIEIWKDHSLVGGIYGIAIGSVFFAESMFSSVSNASKITLIFLLAKLRASDFNLFDIQFLTPHLISMGGVEISRQKYLNSLNNNILLKNKFPDIDSSKESDWLITTSYLQEIKDIS